MGVSVCTQENQRVKTYQVLELAQGHLRADILAHGHERNANDGHGLMPQVALGSLLALLRCTLVVCP